MERKDIAHLAIDLIEKALEKPNQTIVLEQRITKSVYNLTKRPLSEVRDDVMSVVYYLSKNWQYSQHIKDSCQSLLIKNHNPWVTGGVIVYKNGSKIRRRK